MVTAMVFAVAFKVYVSDYYVPDTAVEETICEETSVFEASYEDAIIFVPNYLMCKAVIVFYPGGKVKYTAYSGLMRELADRGFLCVLPRMPENLAFLRMDAVDKIVEKYPEQADLVSHIDWYMAGHSLGGVAAAKYLSDNPEGYKGLILCASYTTSDFSNTDIRLLSIYGSEDKVLKMESYDENRVHWPANSEEYVIEGGIHSYFGNYGIQSGDGEPAISNIEQIRIAADVIEEWIEENN